MATCKFCKASGKDKLLIQSEQNPSLYICQDCARSFKKILKETPKVRSMNKDNVIHLDMSGGDKVV